MTKKQLLDHLKNHVYCRIGKSNVEGVGVIAIKNIPKGIDPFHHKPKHTYIEISERELKQIPPGVRKMIKDFMFVEDGVIYIPAKGLYALDTSYYLNHSDTPNIAYSTKTEQFVTLRNIEEGEELTFNYHHSFGELGFR